MRVHVRSEGWNSFLWMQIRLHQCFSKCGLSSHFYFKRFLPSLEHSTHYWPWRLSLCIIAQRIGSFGPNSYKNLTQLTHVLFTSIPFPKVLAFQWNVLQLSVWLIWAWTLTHHPKFSYLYSPGCRPRASSLSEQYCHTSSTHSNFCFSASFL